MEILTSLFDFNGNLFKKKEKSADKSSCGDIINNFEEKSYKSYSNAVKARGIAQINFGSQAIIIPIDTLKPLLEEGKSAKDIAQELNVSPSLIIKTLRKYGLKTKPQIEHEIQQQRAAKLTKDELQKLIDAGKTTYEIADMYGVTSMTVQYKLKTFGLKTQGQLKQQSQAATVSNITKAQLQQFIDEGKSAEEMSKILNVSRRTILNKFAEFGLQAQTQIQMENIKEKIKNITHENLQQLISEGKSTYELAEIFGVSRQCITRKLIEYGLQTQSQKNNFRQADTETAIPKHELKQLIAQRKTITEIAEIFGVTRQSISRKLMEYGLQTELQAIIKQRTDILSSITADELQQLINKGKTLTEIAELYNVNESTINNKLKEYGLRTFEQIRREAQRLKTGTLDRETLEELINTGKSTIEIAKIYGLSISTIGRKLLEFNLQTKEQLQREITSNIKEKDLRILCKEKNAGEIALIFNVSRQTILNKLKEYGLKTKDQIQREHNALITANQLLEEIAQGKSPKRISESLGVSLSTYHYLLQKFNIKIPQNKKYIETEDKRYERFPFEDIQNRLIELSECNQIIKDEKLEDMISFICDRKSIRNTDKSDIINFVRILDRVNLGLLTTSEANNSNEVKAVLNWKNELTDINDNFNILIGTFYQNEEEEIANICTENYSPDISTNNNIEEAQYIIDILKNAATKKDITNAKYKILYFHTNNTDKSLAAEATNYTRTALGITDPKTAGQYIYYHNKYNQYLNGEEVKTPVKEEFFQALKQNKIQPKIAVPYLMKLDNWFSTDASTSNSLNEFIEKFDINNDMDKEIINTFISNFYINNDTELFAKSDTGKVALVTFSKEAKQEIYETYPSKCMQILCKFENALRKLDADKKEAGIKKYKSEKSVLECKIKDSTDRLFALNNTLIFNTFDSSHKQKTQKQKF